jgi:phage-related holin
MLRTLQEILEKSAERLYVQSTTILPSLLAAAVILVISYVVARGCQWAIRRVYHAVALDRFLSDTGVGSMLGRYGERPAGHLAASSVYWLILLMGALTALSVFDTNLSRQIVEGTVFLFPKLVIAGLILLAGFWLARYLSRSVVVWAFNEQIPHPRRWATAVRIVIVFVAIVVAADTLNFAREVFLAAFIIGVGGAVLTAALAFGLGGREAISRALEARRSERQEEREEDRTLWNHL